MNRLLGFVLVSLLVSSCGDTYSDKLRAVVYENRQVQNTKYDTYIIIPTVGCSGCISSAEVYVGKHKDDQGVCFIFTNIVSKKVLLGRLRHSGVDIEQQENIYLDETNRYYIEDEVDSEYPYVVQIDSKGQTRINPFRDYAKQNDN